MFAGISVALHKLSRLARVGAERETEPGAVMLNFDLWCKLCLSLCCRPGPHSLDLFQVCTPVRERSEPLQTIAIVVNSPASDLSSSHESRTLTAIRL